MAKTAREIAGEFAENTTTHGLGFIKRSSSLFWKFFWILAFLGSLTGFIVQCVDIFIIYYQYPYDVDIRMEYGKEVTFPAVTICNLNPIRVSKVIDALNDDAFVSLMDPLFSSQWPIRLMPKAVNDLHTEKRPPVHPNPMNARQPNPTKDAQSENAQHSPGNPSSNSNTGGKTDNESEDQGPSVGPGAQPTPKPRGRRSSNSSTSYPNVTSIEGFWEQKSSSQQFYDTKPPSVKIVEIFQQVYANMSDDLKVFLGHNMEDMLYECSYNGKECSPQNFTRFFNYKYGSCYTFNPGLPGYPVQTSYRPGPLSGLSISMSVQQNEYVGGLTHEAGLRVLIHSQSVVPFPEDEGFTISPGFATSTGLRLVNITRLKHPYISNCTNGQKTRFTNPEENNHRYSVEACIKSLTQEKIEQKCNCSDASFPVLGNGFSICDTANDQHIAQCVLGAYSELDSMDTSSLCRQLCLDRNYVLTISTSSWPSDQYLNDQMTTVYSARADMTRINATYIRKNLLRLDVFFQQLNYENIEEIGAQGPSYLVSSIGGLAGFYIGVSVCTVCEFLQLVFNLIVNAFRRPKLSSEQVKRQELNASVTPASPSLSLLMHVPKTVSNAEYSWPVGGIDNHYMNAKDNDSYTYRFEIPRSFASPNRRNKVVGVKEFVSYN